MPAAERSPAPRRRRRGWITALAVIGFLGSLSFMSYVVLGGLARDAVDFAEDLREDAAAAIRNEVSDCTFRELDGRREAIVTVTNGTTRANDYQIRFKASGYTGARDGLEGVENVAPGESIIHVLWSEPASESGDPSDLECIVRDVFRVAANP